MNKNKRTSKYDYNINDRHKKKYINKNELDLKNRRDDNKRKNGIQRTRK